MMSTEAPGSLPALHGHGPATSVVTVEDVSFAYGATRVLDGVSLSVPAGEFVALIGANGSGKSTLIRILLGLLAPEHGTVQLFGTSPRALTDRWRVGYVPQRPPSSDYLPATVAEVVAAGRLIRRRWWRRPNVADRTAIDEALQSVGLDHLRSKPLGELSGGQQQRAFIAKALAAGPELLVLDEPTAGVDAEAQRRFRDTLVTARDAGGTVLLVSHELGAVANDLDRVVLVRHGRVAFDGTPTGLATQGVSLGVHDTDLPVWLEDFL
jgi:zinc transport system ATP-binding protein